ncbi:hypothetical protein P7C70_g8988, partial [Phenoliferia sp. Uapishka_3]
MSQASPTPATFSSDFIAMKTAASEQIERAFKSSEAKINEYLLRMSAAPIPSISSSTHKAFEPLKAKKVSAKGSRVNQAFRNAQAAKNRASTHSRSSPSKMRTVRLLGSHPLFSAQTIISRSIQLPSQLSPEHRQLAAAIFREHRTVISSMPGATAGTKDIKRLRPKEWFNDEIITFYSVMINARNKAVHAGASGLDQNDFVKAWCFNSFFYSHLHKNGYTGVKRWSKNVRALFTWL